MTVAGNPAARAKREEILRDYLGYYAETFQLAAAVNNTTMTSGTVYATAIGLLVGDPINNVIAPMVTAGGTLSLTRFGVYNATGSSKIVQSADVHTTFDGGTIGRIPVAMALASNGEVVRAPADGVYLIAGIAVGTTGPTLARATGQNGISIVSGAASAFAGSFAGQSDLPASLTLTTNGQPAFWFGVS